jgi:hypothetical protein
MAVLVSENYITPDATVVDPDPGFPAMRCTPQVPRAYNTTASACLIRASPMALSSVVSYPEVL